MRKIIIFIITMFVLLTFMQACSSEDIGLPSSDSVETETESSSAENGIQLSEEELFLEMKAKQDKNPLSDINVRKAIMHAVDRGRIVEEIFDGYNGVSNSLFAKDSPFWEPSWSEYDFDLDKASEFLDKAGYGTDNPLYITVSAVDNSVSKILIEDIMREDLEKIGINLWIYNESPKEFYQEYVYSGNYDLGLWSLYIFGKDELLCSFSSGKIPSMETEENRNCENFYWYANTNVDNILRQIDSISNIENIQEKAREIQDILAKDAVILPLYSRLFVFAYDNSLRKVDIETIEDRVFYEIEDWLLPLDLELEENEKSEIIIGYESDNIDIFYGFEPYFINDLLFKGLWKKNKDGSYTPELAESYSGFEDELTEIVSDDIDITLRNDIYWDNGDPITSEDVKYTFEYFRDFMEEKEYFSSLDEDYLKINGIEIIDDRNFTIDFEELVVDWQKLFPMVFKKDHFKLDDYDEMLYTRIISNGPYKILEYDSTGQMVLEANEYYHNKLPEIEKLIIKFDLDVRNLIVMLKEGDINFLSIPVDPELMHMLEEENEMNLLIKEGNLMEHLALSLKPKEE